MLINITVNTHLSNIVVWSVGGGGVLLLLAISISDLDDSKSRSYDWEWDRSSLEKGRRLVIEEQLKYGMAKVNLGGGRKLQLYYKG